MAMNAEILDPNPAKTALELADAAARDALAECQLRLEQKGLGQYIVLSIHDELVFELPESRAVPLRDQIAETMTFEVNGVPVLCKPSRLAKRWSDCYREKV